MIIKLQHNEGLGVINVAWERRERKRKRMRERERERERENERERERERVVCYRVIYISESYTCGKKSELVTV
jgi:hypothetical protein